MSRILKPDDIVAMKLASHTSILGWPMRGLWRKDAQLHDVTSVCRNASGDFLACGDRFGKVSLFSFPLRGEAAPCEVFEGHSGPLVSVLFAK